MLYRRQFVVNFFSAFHQNIVNIFVNYNLKKLVKFRWIY